MKKNVKNKFNFGVGDLLIWIGTFFNLPLIFTIFLELKTIELMSLFGSTLIVIGIVTIFSLNVIDLIRKMKGEDD